MRIEHRNWMSFIAALLAVAGLWFFAAPAVSAPLNLTQQFPDIQVSDLDIAYDAGTGSFTANQDAFAWFEYSADGVSSTGAGDWTYSLTASLDSGTGALTSGSLEIRDGSSATQLSGDLTAFGFADDPTGDSDVFEFLFDVTGGALAGDFGALGGIIIVTDTSDFAGDFGTGFTAASTSNDTFAVVPVPAAVWLFGSGLLGLAAAARRRH